ncbi:MAG: V-type ATP synthase subunit I, partial [Planctomycetota bacterium]
MLLNASMRWMRIITLQRHEDAVNEAIGRLGVVEFETTEEGGVWPREEKAREKLDRCAELKRRLVSLMNWFGVDIPQVSAEEPVRGFALDEVSKLMNQVEEEARPIGEQLDDLEAEIERCRNIIDDLEPYRSIEVSPEELGETSFIHVTAGNIPSARLPNLRAEAPEDAVLVPLGRTESQGTELEWLLVMSSRRSRFALETLLEDNQFEEQPLPVDYERPPAELYREAREKREELRNRQEELQEPLLQIGRSHRAEFQAAYKKVVREMELGGGEKYHGTTWATVVITGWCPQSEEERVREAIEDTTDGIAIVESRAATEEEMEKGRVPTYVPMPGFLKPFRAMALGFGVPEYREIEPTILFAISFLLLFGVMFGDLGHGLCLVIAGMCLRHWTRRSDLRDVGYVIVASGLTGAIFGAFFQGSMFGASLQEYGWPLTLGMEPIHLAPGVSGQEVSAQVIRYMFLAMMLGIGLISLGVVVNICSRIRAAEYEEGLLGGFGLAGGLFYWGTIGIIVHVATAGRWSGLDTLLVLGTILLPLLVLALREPIYSLATGRGRLWSEGPFFCIFEGCLDVMETVMSYLANTFSFLRVAAFALSHVALSFTILVLQDLVTGLPGGLFWSALTAVAGTML